MFIFLNQVDLSGTMYEWVEQETRATETSLYIFKKSYIAIKIQGAHYSLICYNLEDTILNKNEHRRVWKRIYK